jgi:hypothetical protein
MPLKMKVGVVCPNCDHGVDVEIDRGAEGGCDIRYFAPTTSAPKGYTHQRSVAHTPDYVRHLESQNKGLRRRVWGLRHQAKCQSRHRSKLVRKIEMVTTQESYVEVRKQYRYQKSRADGLFVRAEQGDEAFDTLAAYVRKMATNFERTGNHGIAHDMRAALMVAEASRPILF